MLMKVFNKGQVVIPVAMRRELGVRVGDMLDVRVDRRKQMIQLFRPERMEAERLGGSLSKYRGNLPSRSVMHEALAKGLTREKTAD